MIKELRKRETDTIEPGPIQVAKNNALLGFLLCGLDQTHLYAKIAPVVAVVDYSIDPRPKLRVNRLVKFFLPPKIKREVRIQIGKDDARQLYGAPAFEQE